MSHRNATTRTRIMAKITSFCACSSTAIKGEKLSPQPAKGLLLFMAECAAGAQGDEPEMSESACPGCGRISYAPQERG